MTNHSLQEFWDAIEYHSFASDFDLPSVVFEKMTLSEGTSIEDCNFTNSGLMNATLHDTFFSGCNFTNARFHSADLDRCNFYMCDFYGANLFNASLESASFSHCENILQFGPLPNCGLHLHAVNTPTGAWIHCQLLRIWESATSLLERLANDPYLFAPYYFDEKKRAAMLIDRALIEGFTKLATQAFMEGETK